jgi:HEAT repeats
MNPDDHSNSFASIFSAHFGELVLLLRRQPGNVPAQKSALRSAMTVLGRGGARIETGIEHSEVPDDSSLQGRLLIRHVDAIQFAPTATPAQVLAMARALAADSGDFPSTAGATADLLRPSGVRHDLEPGEPVAPADLPPPLPPPPVQRHRTMAGPLAESETLTQALERAVGQGYWLEALHAAQALIQLTPRFPEHEQRAHLLALRRLFTRDLLTRFIDFALRVTEEQARVSEVLHHAGPEAVELMVDQVRRAESIGPRKFLHDAIASSPSSLPLLLPLLTSAKWHEARHGAELLGRLGLPEAIEPLRAALNHPDERVRKTVVDALGCFNQPVVVEPIRRALSDPAPATRASAAHALSQRNSPGLALPILVALESEKHPETWSALVSALARIDSNEAMAALVTIAIDKRHLFKPGRSMAQRITVINALASADSALARRALERLANEGEGDVKRAALAAVEQLNRAESR